MYCWEDELKRIFHLGHQPRLHASNYTLKVLQVIAAKAALGLPETWCRNAIRHYFILTSVKEHIEAHVLPHDRVSLV